MQFSTRVLGAEDFSAVSDGFQMFRAALGFRLVINMHAFPSACMASSWRASEIGAHELAVLDAIIATWSCSRLGEGTRIQRVLRGRHPLWELTSLRGTERRA